MKLLIRGLFTFTWLCAALIFGGCRSSSQGEFVSEKGQPKPAFPVAPQSSNPAAGSTNTQANVSSLLSSDNVARFRIGQTVLVTFSGSPVEIPPHAEPIKEDGTITLPLIGAVNALGKSAGELQNEIYSDYVPKYYVRLTVTVTSSDRVYYVGGEVRAPNREVYLGDTTLTKAIQTAGGLTDFANHHKVYLIRASNGQRIRVDYDKALENPAKDPPVYPDDQIIVEKSYF
jgi:protein involved in polysaccharide export with SLBB domain